MEKTKVTKKDLYNGIINFVNGNKTAITVDEIVAFCEKEIENLAKKAAKAKENAAKKKADGDALTETVKSVLTGNYEPIAAITAKVAEIDADATVAKVTYRLGQLVNANEAEKQEITVPSGENKTRKVMGYKLYGAEPEAVEDIEVEA